MKTRMKIVISVVVIVIASVALLFYNAFNGNPISKMKAKNSAEKYVNENYEDQDLIIEDVFYNFKDGYYHAQITSESSVDTHFSLAFNKGKLQFDTYEDDVLSGWNTYQRIDNEYREMVKDVFNNEDFPLVSEIDYGTIELLENVILEGMNVPKYGVKLDELELDKKYDIKQLAKEHGHIIYYAQNKEISFEKMSELLIILKQSLDEAGVPFYAIDFTLEKPRDPGGTNNKDDSNIYTAHFLYEDIYDEGLIERLKENSTALMDYYEKEDAKMK